MLPLRDVMYLDERVRRQLPPANMNNQPQGREGRARVKKEERMSAFLKIVLAIETNQSQQPT